MFRAIDVSKPVKFRAARGRTLGHDANSRHMSKHLLAWYQQNPTFMVEAVHGSNDRSDLFKVIGYHDPEWERAGYAYVDISDIKNA